MVLHFEFHFHSQLKSMCFYSLKNAWHISVFASEWYHTKLRNMLFAVDYTGVNLIRSLSLYLSYSVRGTPTCVIFSFQRPVVKTNIVQILFIIPP